MTDSILDATEQYNSMTRSGKKLANYILSNTAETQYLSIIAGWKIPVYRKRLLPGFAVCWD